MTLGTTLLSLVRSRVVAQLERCRCPILYTLVPKFYYGVFFSLKQLKNLKASFSGGDFFLVFFPK